MMEIFVVHGKVVALDLIVSAMVLVIVIMEKKKKIAVCICNYIIISM